MIIDNDMRVKLEGIARFLPVFTAPGFRFGTWETSSLDSSDIPEMPFCSLSATAAEFVKAIYKLGWVKQFQWSSWMQTPEGRELMGSPARVATATPIQLAKLLTVCIRGDRFNEGLLNGAFESGLLTAIVKRADRFLREPSPEAAHDV